MLDAPLGEIEVIIDDREVDNREEKVPLDENCPDLSGRYKISVDFAPDGAEHTIACRIKFYRPGSEDFVL